MQLRIGLLVLTTFFVLLSSQVFAQKSYQNYLEISYDQGAIVDPNRGWSTDLIKAINYSAFDMRFGWRSKENTIYEYMNRYPIFGLGFTSALSYYQQIGRPMSIYGYGEFPFGKNSIYKKVNFSYYVQVGLGFNMNPYDAENNPDNQFIGSSVNAHVAMGFKANYQFSKSFGVFTSIGLKHYSNGSFKKPNSGINLVPLALGIRTNFGEDSFSAPIEFNYPPFEKGALWNFAIYAGAKSYEIGERNYFRGGLGVNYLWKLNYKYSAGLGIDWFYGAGVKDRYPSEKINFLDQNSFAVVGSWEWRLTKRIYMPIGFGVYLTNSDYNQEFAWFYERIGLRYLINDHVFAGIQIKAHKAKADFFEFTLGYTLPDNKVRVNNK